MSTLTEDIAKKFREAPGDTDLSGYTEITPEAAAVLATCDADVALDLDGIAAISDAAAEALSKFEGEISLRGLAVVSDATKVAFQDRKARVFGWGYSNVVLMACCAECGTKKNFNFWHDDHNCEAEHETLVKGGWDTNDWGQPLCPECYLLQNIYEEMDRLTTLSDAAAEALAKHFGFLELSGLTTLSDAAAEALAKHQGEALVLDGLTTLSDTAAEALANHANLSVSDAVRPMIDKCRNQ